MAFCCDRDEGWWRGVKGLACIGGKGEEWETIYTFWMAKYGLSDLARVKMWSCRLPPITSTPYNLPLPAYTSIVSSYGTVCPFERDIKSEIHRDVERSVFGRRTNVGVPSVERVLLAAAFCRSDVGYAQGMDYVAANIWFTLKAAGEEGGGWEYVRPKRNMGDDVNTESLLSSTSAGGVWGEDGGGAPGGARINVVLGGVLDSALGAVETVVQQEEGTSVEAIASDGEDTMETGSMEESGMSWLLCNTISGGGGREVIRLGSGISSAPSITQGQESREDQDSSTLAPGEFETYVLFARLMHHRRLADMYSPGLRTLRGMVAEFDGLIGLHLKVLKEHFEREELNTQTFSLGWFQTLFLTVPNIPFSTVSRIWDVYITADSSSILHQCGLAILAGSQALLLNMDFEECMEFLQNIPGGENSILQPRRLMMLAATFEV
ncbi:hypothetical protein TrRE_jg7874 [Triparma retinervis]|uniref:Rab-GAP TBC domain-containing protein n=1 Tax=Triparma retinervis TaxID=2557542 RepID=A0A9W7DQ15_9STRA|nr:hypothetical protein TrRE_jg7874 [Triparma retinervis]